MKNPLSVAATVLKPYDSASLYEKEGQMKLQPLLEKKQKMQQAESEFAGVMAEIDKYSSDVWEQDWQQVSKMKDEFLDNAARVYEDAHFNGRDLSITEHYQIKKGLGELAQKATMSKANKTFYEKTAYQIMTNPDKYDVEASMYLLNKGYKEGQLGARSVQNFMVPRFNIDAFRKKIQLPYTETGVRGGNRVREVDEEKLREQIIIGARTDEGVSQRLQTMIPEEQTKWVEDEVQWHLKRGNYTNLPLARAGAGSGSSKTKMPLVITKENLASMSLPGMAKGSVAAKDNANVIRISPGRTKISTTKGDYDILGIFKDMKTGGLFAYGYGKDPDDDTKEILTAIPYDEIGAALEEKTKRTKQEIETAFGGVGKQTPAKGIGSKYKGQ